MGNGILKVEGESFNFSNGEKYVIFARVTSGMEAVDALANVQTTMGDDGNMSRPVTPVRITKVTVKP